MKTPRFWNSRNRIAYLLWPFSILYEMLYTLRRAAILQLRLRVPVVCVGNITAGGSGKTPLALLLGKLFKERGVAAFFVSRGYGGTLQGPIRVDVMNHQSHEVGDEPLLLANVLPTVVGKDRLQAAKFAIRQGAKLLIFDDGFQDKRIYKDYSFLVVDGTIGFGNGFLLPAGPLRERFDVALIRAHSVVVINPTVTSPPIPEDKPTILARTRVCGLAEKLRGRKVVGFCGIAYPEKFRNTLVNLGASIVEFAGFSDHQPYSLKMLMPLIERASEEKAYLVTTEKDWVRLPEVLRDKVVVVEIELLFSNSDLLKLHIDYIASLT